MIDELEKKQIIWELLIDNRYEQLDKDNEVLKIAKDSLERKKQKTEKEVVSENDQPFILSAIKAFAVHLSENEPESSNNRNILENILTEYSINIKTKYYS